ncbi:MAG: hypothetical protein IPI10_15305 [Bacteroidetes bacterium]|nr:hypothetical protein [Bacteroidota bacterium]
MSTQMDVDGALQFTFDNILLPDSNVDEPGSHGFVNYRISPKAGLPDRSDHQYCSAFSLMQIRLL